MGLKNIKEKLIERFATGNLKLIQDFDGNFSQKNENLVLTIDNIENPYPQVFKMRLVFFGHTFSEFDKDKAKLDDLATAVDTLLGSITMTELQTLTGETVIGWYREDDVTNESDGESHTFSITYTLVVADFVL